MQPIQGHHWYYNVIEPEIKEEKRLIRNQGMKNLFEVKKEDDSVDETIRKIFHEEVNHDESQSV